MPASNSSMRSILPAGMVRILLLKRQDLSARDGLALDVALHPLRRHVEDRAVAQRAQQLDVLGMRPDQRHGAARGPAARAAPRLGISAPSQTCSGSRPPVPALASSVASRLCG